MSGESGETSESSEPSEPRTVSLYEYVGGDDFFVRLVDAFYEGVETDDVLLPLYPEPADLGPARRRLALFLIQYWGGPTTYLDEPAAEHLRNDTGLPISSAKPAP
jgi:hemoglobin